MAICADSITPGISTNTDTDFLYKGPHRSFKRFLTALYPVPFSSTPHKVVVHQIMSLFAILLASLFFFPGFAAAGIAAPGCLAPLAWVCMLSQLCVLGSLSDLSAPRSDIQQFAPRSVRGRSVPVVDMQRGLSVLLLTLPVLAFTILADSSLLQRSPSIPCRWATRTGGQVALTTAICASATPSYIISLVHVTHARERNGFRTAIAIDFPFQIPGLTYP